jgi:ubiquitin C-terminal hydrolase
MLFVHARRVENGEPFSHGEPVFCRILQNNDTNGRIFKNKKTSNTNGSLNNSSSHSNSSRSSNGNKNHHHHHHNPVILLPAATSTSLTVRTPHAVAPLPAAVRTYRRPFGSGLGNLGNTCFMNSTLQCLAHTEPLQRYFLSGAYKGDLNRDNPLGTRGELATQFAKLLADMWLATGNNNNNGSLDHHHVVYPRDFKYTLGKHAEQFVGYDQHDSQELATYLLDALHEDCNRVTHKPYVEKPEQGPNETDQEAADKAWNLHLQRDNSQVIENFMGQVKSRLECPKCQKVSTTFDPFMYLSVPIPGSDMRTLDVLFAPLDPLRCAEVHRVTVPKMGTVGDVVKAVLQARKERGQSVPSLENCIAGELYFKSIWKWMDSSFAIDEVTEKDEIIIFELNDIKEIHKLVEAQHPKVEPIVLPPVPKSGTLHDRLMVMRLNQGDAWINHFHKYLKRYMVFEHLWNKKPLEDKVDFFGLVVDFIKDCQNPEGKRPRDDDDADSEERKQADDDELPSPTIEQACSRSATFKDVKTRRDVLILELIALRMRRHLENIIGNAEPRNPNGILLEIRCSNGTDLIAPSFCVRVPGSTTIFELRELIAYRLQRSIRNRSVSTGEPTSERPHDRYSNNTICKLPMRWGKRASMYKATSGSKYSNGWPYLGGVEKEESFADPNMPAEKATLDEYFEDHGMVALEWSKQNVDLFDVQEYQRLDNRTSDIKKDDDGLEQITVSDCINKFCHREQLEETEQWYCSRCKDHVCAWKQFDLFRSPPHLIVHLKRFQFSANCHRRQKIGHFVDFPLKGLDLTNHVLHWEDGEQPIYDCYAVSNHFGGLGGGHYTAFAINGDTWCNYDDSRITTDVDTKDVVSEAAYVLYYRRRDVPVGADFEIDLQTMDDAIMPPVIIASDNSSRVAWGEDPPSQNATMVDADEETNDNLHGPLSRSTSPASVGALNGEYEDTNSDTGDFSRFDEDDVEVNHNSQQRRQ